jgi:hypothetical protein
MRYHVRVQPAAAGDERADAPRDGFIGTVGIR